MQDTILQTADAGVSQSDSGFRSLSECRRHSIRQRMQDSIRQMQETIYQTADAGVSHQTADAGDTLSDTLSDGCGCIRQRMQKLSIRQRYSIRQRMQETHSIRQRMQRQWMQEILYKTADAGDTLSLDAGDTL